MTAPAKDGESLAAKAGQERFPPRSVWNLKLISIRHDKNLIFNLNSLEGFKHLTVLFLFAGAYDCSGFFMPEAAAEAAQAGQEIL